MLGRIVTQLGGRPDLQRSKQIVFSKVDVLCSLRNSWGDSLVVGTFEILQQLILDAGILILFLLQTSLRVND